jgi:hypothetical protein
VRSRRQRNVYERREQGRVFCGVEPDKPQRVLEIREALLGRGIHTKALPAPFRDWMKRGILQELRGSPFDPGVRRLRQARMELLDEPRLAESRFADDQHQLAFASLCAVPPARKRTELLLAADKRR